MKILKPTFSISSHILQIGALGAMGTLSASGAVVMHSGPAGSNAEINFDPVSGVTSYGTAASGFTGYSLLVTLPEPFVKTYDIGSSDTLYRSSADAGTTTRFSTGQIIDSTSTYTQTSRLYDDSLPAVSGNWSETSPDNTGYLGLQFEIAGDDHYGWAEITLNDDGTIELARFAYNDVAGESITAGQVPEPSSAALLILGAAGALTRRQRKAA
jgi:hypothetical protein